MLQSLPSQRTKPPAKTTWAAFSQQS